MSESQQDGVTLIDVAPPTEAPGHTLQKLYSDEDVRNLIESSAWTHLRPNFSREDQLLPQALDQKTIEKVVDVLLAIPDIGEPAYQHSPEIEEVIPRIGTIKNLGDGETKKVFILITDTGKKIVIGFLPDYEKDAQIPQDPHLYQRQEAIYDINRTQHYDLFEYSDMRTYLCLPFKSDKRKYGMYFQEYGGETFRTRQGLPFLARIAANRAKNRISEFGGEVVDPEEFNHSENYLFPKGRLSPPAVIDINVRRLSR